MFTGIDVTCHLVQFVPVHVYSPALWWVGLGAPQGSVHPRADPSELPIACTCVHVCCVRILCGRCEAHHVRLHAHYALVPLFLDPFDAEALLWYSSCQGFSYVRPDSTA